jgi:hypothetical protein
MSEIEKYRHWLLSLTRLATLKHFPSIYEATDKRFERMKADEVSNGVAFVWYFKDMEYIGCDFDSFCNKKDGHGVTQLEHSVKLFNNEVKQIFL